MTSNVHVNLRCITKTHWPGCLMLLSVIGGGTWKHHRIGAINLAKPSGPGLS